MTRRDMAMGLVATSAALAASGAGATMTMTTGGLDDQVRHLLDRWVAAWNAADLDAMFALFTEDAHWVNIVGMHWQGRAQVRHAHQVYFDLMFKGVPQSLEAIESIVPIAGGGAIVVARFAVGAFRTPDGHLNPPGLDRMSLVLIASGGGLAIAHGANVAIVEQAQRFDPARAAPAVSRSR